MSFSWNNFSGVLLDFDGTLADTEFLHQKALHAFFQTKGYVFDKKEPGKSTMHIFRDWGKEIGKPELAGKFLPEYLEFLPQFLRDHAYEIDWYEDAKALLEYTKNWSRVLVTGSFREWLLALDEKLGIFSKFEHFVTKDDLLPDKEKPSPYAYQLGARKLNLSPSDCLAVEDSTVGVQSAKSAGCFVVAVRRDEVSDLGPADLVVDSLKEIL